MDDNSGTRAFAKRWLDSTLELSHTNEAAAESAVRDMEKLTKKLRGILDFKSECDAHDAPAEANGVVVPLHSDEPVQDARGLSRNQMSKVRAVTLMDVMKDDVHHSLAALQSALGARGFTGETEAAVRSALFRLKESGYIVTVGTGVYKLTPEGFEHLQRERVAQEPLLNKFEDAMR